MLTNQVLAIDKSLELAFINPQKGNRSRKETDIEHINPERVHYGYRVNGIHYRSLSRLNRTIESDPDTFMVTDERSYGFLVKMLNRNGDEVYAVIKPANIISTKSEYRKYWDAEEALRKVEAEAEAERQRIIQEKRQARSAIEQERLVPAQAEAERFSESINESVRDLLGNDAYLKCYVDIRPTGEWQNLDTPDERYVTGVNGTVRLAFKDFQRLLEKALAE